MAQVVLVSGGTGALGIAMCKLFCAQGHTVVANCHAADEARSLNVVQELQDQGLQISLKVFDVTDVASCAQAVQDLETKIGPLAVLINAAGITNDAKLKALAPEQWRSVIDTNLNSVYNLTRPCIGPMSERQYGRIVNISSVNGQRGQIGQTNYSAAKAGMTGFTKALARELARDGITVNSVSPGYVNSPMIAAVPDKVREKLLTEIPVGRFAQPDEIARAVAFLAHNDSGYITGTDLSVNGGFYI